MIKLNTITPQLKAVGELAQAGTSGDIKNAELVLEEFQIQDASMTRYNYSGRKASTSPNLELWQDHQRGSSPWGLHLRL